MWYPDVLYNLEINLSSVILVCVYKNRSKGEEV